MIHLIARDWSRRTRLSILAIVLFSALVLLILAPRLPLGSNYHDFADKRTLLGLPNALDVLSNVPFMVVGFWGLIWFGSEKGRRAFAKNEQRIPYQIFFAGVLLTGFGSFWYHLAPSDGRLPWDLLPMTCSFTSLVIVTFTERVDEKMGFIALIPALLLGVASVLYWTFTTDLGNGDYKFYLFVQFFSPVLLMLIIGMFAPRYTGLRYLIAAFGLYVAAKLFETFDYAIYRKDGGVISGHSLKHVTAAIACFYLLLMLVKRQSLGRR